MVRPLHQVDQMQTKWQVKLPTGPIADACDAEVLEAFRLGCVTPETLMRRSPQASWISFQETALLATATEIRTKPVVDRAFAMPIVHSPPEPTPPTPSLPRASLRSEPPLVGIFAGVSLVLLVLLWLASTFEAPQVEGSDLHAIVVSRAR